MATHSPIVAPQSLRWAIFAAFSAMLLWSCRSLFDFGELFMQLKGKSFLERGSIGASEWQCFLSRAGRREGEQVFAKVHRELARATRGGVTPTQVILSANVIVIVNPKSNSPSHNLGPVIVVRSEDDLPDNILSNGVAALVRSEKEFSSDLEDGWRWTAELSSQLPPNAKVFLNEPSLMLYYFTTFMWYPRPVDVDTQATKISDAKTFETVFRKDPSRLDPANLGSLRDKLESLGYTHLTIRKGDQRELINLRTGKEGP